MADHGSPARKALPVFALLLTGCVLGADAPSPTDPHGLTTTTTLEVTTITQTRDEGLAAFGECMSGEGVAIPEIPRDARGRPRMGMALQGIDLGDPAVIDALGLCGEHLATGALALGADPEMQELVQSTLQDLVVCLRGRGVGDFPEPVPGYEGMGVPFPVNRIPWSDPDLPSAIRACVGQTS